MLKSNDFMELALEMANRALEHGDVPIGAVIVHNGAVVATGENRVQVDQDPTAHAEIVALRSAVAKTGHKFLPDGSAIYITLEPCAMCATALSFARAGKIIFAARDEKGGAILHNSRIFETDRHLFRPEIVESPALAAASAKLLQDFFKKLRTKK